MARVLLIVGGGIAAYKSLELVRLLRKADHEVTPVLTKGGEHLVRTGVTSWSAFLSRRTSSSDLYAAIPPPTMRSTRAMCSI